MKTHPRKPQPGASHRKTGKPAHRTPHHKGTVDHKSSPALLTGTIAITSRGGLFIIDKKSEPLHVPFEALETALQGDTVTVKRVGSREARVVEILTRARTGFTGTIAKNEKGYYLVTADNKLYFELQFAKSDLHGAVEGDKVFAAIESFSPNADSAKGRVLRVLGKPLAHNAEMVGIILERGFEEDFPRDVLVAAKQLETAGITDADKAGRRDFRGITTLTIDPVDAKDFDDALSLREMPSGMYEVGVHIADVSHYVRPGSALDAEALRRATSLYLVDRTVPMLPEALSNDLCSLKPKVDRLAMSAVFTIDKDGKIKDEWFGKTVIHSSARLTYESAQEILDKKKGEFYTELNILNSIAKKLNTKRFYEGSVLLDTEEVKFVLDPEGKPLNVVIKVRTDTHKLVEEWMLLANRRIALYLSGNEKKTGKIALYRIHDMPTKERTADLKLFLKHIGVAFPTTGPLSARDINKLLDRLEGRAERDVVMSTVIRTMEKAIYSTKNVGHFGLGFAHYAHFTSPIRRYPDLTIHRLVEDVLSGKKLPQGREKEFEEIARYTSERERAAAAAERTSVKYKQVEYMSARIGQEFDGLVTGVTEWGIYVADTKTKCEGMIRLKDLGQERFVFKEKELSLIGEKSKVRYRLGDKVRFRVLAADLMRRTLDYQLVVK